VNDINSFFSVHFDKNANSKLGVDRGKREEIRKYYSRIINTVTKLIAKKFLQKKNFINIVDTNLNNNSQRYPNVFILHLCCSLSKAYNKDTNNLLPDTTTESINSIKQLYRAVLPMLEQESMQNLSKKRKVKFISDTKLIRDC
jgi:hypothetical protein